LNTTGEHRPSPPMYDFRAEQQSTTSFEQSLCLIQQTGTSWLGE
jgi:hypothetical protein